MSSGPPPGAAAAGPGLALGAAAQAAAAYLGFRHPGWFWAVLPPSLAGSGLPALRRLRGAPQPAGTGWLAAGVLAGAVGYGLSFLGARLLGRWPLPARSLSRLRACAASAPRPAAALLAVPAAVGEEVFWRDAVLGQALERGERRRLASAAVTTIAYAAVQAASLEPLPPLGALLLGGGTSWLRIKSRSIWPAVAAHVVYTELCLVAPGLPAPPGDGKGSQT